MKKSYLHVFSVLTTVLVLLAGCRSEIRLDNVDPTIEAQMKLALPIGSISAKVSDFMGTSDDAEFYIDTLNGKGVVTWHRSFNFHEDIDNYVDMPSKIEGQSYDVNLYTMIKPAHYTDPVNPLISFDLVGDDDKINLPAGYTFSDSLEFEMPMIIKDINQVGKTERVDSAQFTTANFSVTLDRNNFADMQWEWIDKITVDLSEHILGTTQIFDLYTKGDGYGFGQKMPINLSNVTLDLMKDHSQPVGSDNVYDRITIKAKVKYTVPGPTTAQLYNNSGLTCKFGVETIKVKAIWGWFTDNASYFSEELNISYNPYTFLNGARLPLAKPSIDATLETPIAGNILFLVDHLYMLDSAGVKHSATWNGSEQLSKPFTTADGCVDPINDPLDKVAKLKFRFDETPENGDIDELLTEMPRKFAYKVGVNFDKATTPQIRIAGNLYVDAKATAKVPIEFHKGIKIAYSDTIKGIKLEEASIDSLLKEVNWVDTLKTTNVHVYATVYNGIPLDIKGTFYCLDADNNKIMDPNNPSQVWTIFTDTLNLPGGTYDTGTRDVTPAKKLNICEMTKERLDLFPKIKSIVYDAYVTDDCIQNAPFGAQINGTNSVKVTLGLTADIDAVINVLNIKTDDVRL